MYLTGQRNIKTRWLPSVEDISSPTTDEIDAGIDINAHITASGLGIDITQNQASTLMLDTGKYAKSPGSADATIAITSLRDSDEEEDVIWELFERNLEGCLLVSPFGPPEEDSRVYVFECVSDDPVPVAPTDDDHQQSTVNLGASDWDLKAVVASSGGGGG